MSNQSVYVVTQNGHPTLVFAGGTSARKWIAERGTKDINGNPIVWRAEKFEFVPLTLDDETEEHLRSEARRHMRL
jgi:hypothetical protein